MQHLKLAALIARASLEPSGIIKRGQEDANGTGQVLFMILGALTIASIVPAILYTTYTLSALFPVLTVVESHSDYVPLKQAENDESGKEKSSSIEEPSASHQQQLTSGIRALHRVLYSLSGFRSLFRAINIMMYYNSVTALIVIVLSLIPYMPVPVASLVADLIAVPIHVSWVHWAITTPGRHRAWYRTPEFKSTLKATAIPTMILAFANQVAVELPGVVLQLLRIEVDEPLGMGYKVPKVTGVDSGYHLALFYTIFLGVVATCYIPAQAALIRIEASLLPAEEETIVSVDRTFGMNNVERDGALSFLNAIKSMKGSWGRLYKLYIKIFFMTFAIESILVALVILCVVATSH
ncbi:hypothetical protein JX266_010048 [Neoarthrinium moseri]|uniref:uncharacterized protein n=1 Tax=Neoarthrinium moseri TaxID=1658444 RepID=UPI001FDDB2E0|nr:uncharacterized protein JN550_004646 [Neoarthrinium moseri]KAI1843789.1 hypothetical protein JX266_010048 [Neoarthrinium moseri]KAI1871201.1 hypothetical protein JN550_004646 [Neoarthrinium moseri]